MTSFKLKMDQKNAEILENDFDKHIGKLVERLRVRFRSRRSEVQISGRSNLTQCCQQLVTAATFFEGSCVAHTRNDAELGPANSQHASA